jgi:hypothetical protein
MMAISAGIIRYGRMVVSDLYISKAVVELDSSVELYRVAVYQMLKPYGTSLELTA